MDGPLLERTRAGYDTVAEAYAAALPDLGFEAELDLAMIDRWVSMLPVAACVLDAGCGTGRMLPHLRERDPGMVLAGVDLSAGMLAQARGRDAAAQLAVGELAALPYADGNLDGVLAWYSIIHTPSRDLPRVCAELRRVLRPGGALLLGFQAGTGSRRIARAYGLEVDLTAFLHEVRDVAGTLESAGFALDTALDRGPRASEEHRQGFVIARTPDERDGEERAARLSAPASGRNGR
ncbi:class I SAM-dependent DNA methyltransferase [Demequina gelatinilytica]|uniref:class I SAM-dependent DNA methyltransferase n=1 Tax=Demequina gelatinilytica TaxID=1638980 RepID=UPI00078618FB|nr:class I SAM-dependent methyltransferase [Demequina gelatinilytica]